MLEDGYYDLTNAEMGLVPNDVPFEPRNSLLFGRRGNGKTLLAVALAKGIAAAEEKKILANFRMDGGKFIPTQDWPAKMRPGAKLDKNAVVVLDAVDELADCYSDLRPYMRQMKALGASVIMTSQKVGRTLGILNQLDVLIECRDDHRRNADWRGRTVTARLFDVSGEESKSEFLRGFQSEDEFPLLAPVVRRYCGMDDFWGKYAA